MSAFDGAKVVVVTGASGGIGGALVETLAKAKWRVVATDVAPLPQIVDVLSLQLDVTSSAAWNQMFATVIDRLGRVDALVNCAGIPGRGQIADIDDEAWAQVIAVNQTGTFYGIRAAAPILRDGGGGSIVNVSSAAGLVGFKDHISYVASKFAVTGMTKAAALELGPDGIRVNSVHPGPVATSLASGKLPGQPIERFAQPHEIAELVAYLLSDEASYATGAAYPLDGGLTAGIHR